MLRALIGIAGVDGTNRQGQAGPQEVSMRIRHAIVASLVFGALLLAISPVDAKTHSKPDATIRFSGGSVAAGIGYSWGSGTLHFKGKDYPLEVSGLSVGEVGAAKVEASGAVFNLHRVEDINGTFTSVHAGAAIAGGGSAAAMRNQNGV